jgi:hypothetical protein
MRAAKMRKRESAIAKRADDRAAFTDGLPQLCRSLSPWFELLAHQIFPRLPFPNQR